MFRAHFEPLTDAAHHGDLRAAADPRQHPRASKRFLVQRGGAHGFIQTRLECAARRRSGLHADAPAAMARPQDGSPICPLGD